ncbi:hypothetical protein [Anaerotignum sp. MB30-C6]|uniref:hypothetical protein n=1 Tax=Anaerotignum sp. MB30-C6 TaxID=3070814 RepID=UPI0027DB63CE|nr:hypothetical protein [Anaerotignum sp. MB30-C6]WMI81814.1 hypothetical protein RBQ60_03545 [Anaerotignum sp. MB30-C6]
MDGWIKLHRCSLENPTICKDSDYFAVWCYLLLNATHQPIDVIFNGERITLQEGQLITGRNKISEQFNINPSKVQRILKNLEIEHQIEQQTGNKNRMISIVNWELYQQSEQQNEQQLNNKRTTTEQQLNTNKNIRTKEHKNKDIKNNKASSDAVVSSYTQNQELRNAISDFIEMRKNIKAKMTDRALELMLGKLDKLGGDDEEKIKILQQSIMNSWKGIFELKDRGDKNAKHRNDNAKGATGTKETEGERLNRIALEYQRDKQGGLQDTECDF